LPKPPPRIRCAGKAGARKWNTLAWQARALAPNRSLTRLNEKWSISSAGFARATHSWGRLRRGPSRPPPTKRRRWALIMALAVRAGHDGVVHRDAGLLRLLDRGEHALEVLEDHLHERLLRALPVHQEPRGHRTLRVPDVAGEEVLDRPHVLGVDHGLEVHHAEIAAALEGAGLVEHVGEAAGHAGREVPARLADDDHAPARHVLAAVVPGSLDHRQSAAVAHREALARHAAEVGLAAGGAVEHHVADEDVLLGHEGRLAGRVDDDLAAREPLGDVIVGIALEGEGDPAREEGPEALAGGAREVDADRVVGQPLDTVAPRDLGAEDGA